MLMSWQRRRSTRLGTQRLRNPPLELTAPLVSSGCMFLGAKCSIQLAIPRLVLLRSSLRFYLPTKLEWARTPCMKLPTRLIVPRSGPTMKLIFLLSIPKLKLAGIMDILISLLLLKTLKFATL